MFLNGKILFFVSMFSLIFSTNSYAKSCLNEILDVMQPKSQVVESPSCEPSSLPSLPLEIPPLAIGTPTIKCWDSSLPENELEVLKTLLPKSSITNQQYWNDYMIPEIKKEDLSDVNCKEQERRYSKKSNSLFDKHKIKKFILLAN